MLARNRQMQFIFHNWNVCSIPTVKMHLFLYLLFQIYLFKIWLHLRQSKTYYRLWQRVGNRIYNSGNTYSKKSFPNNISWRSTTRSFLLLARTKARRYSQLRMQTDLLIISTASISERSASVNKSSSGWKSVSLISSSKITKLDTSWRAFFNLAWVAIWQ